MLYWGFVGQGQFVGPPTSGSENPFTMPQMRYAGRRDKKSVEIYQGDIIKQNFQNEFGSFNEGIGVLTYCPACMALEVVRIENGMRKKYGLGFNCEVIGHIFKDKHLLK